MAIIALAVRSTGTRSASLCWPPYTALMNPLPIYTHRHRYRPVDELTHSTRTVTTQR